MKMRVKGKVCPLFLSCRLQLFIVNSVARPERAQRTEKVGRLGERRDPSGCVACPLGQRVHTIYPFDPGERMMQERRMKRILNGKIEERAPLERRGRSSHDGEDEDGRGKRRV